jgi:hypothetical protein
MSGIRAANAPREEVENGFFLPAGGLGDPRLFL